MGVMDFIKDAGEKLAEMGQNAEMAKRIQERIERFGVPIKGLEVSVADDVVTLKGVSATEEDQEKALLIAGNVRGISRVSDQITVKGSPDKTAKVRQGKMRFHTVQKGDTLSAISKKFYGDANKYSRIFEANKPMLESPDRIYPGQVLRVPE
ncbi:MAG: peptidoglycan-binding protein LysM [Candidatus Fermentibacteraceae bacterium]|jgi:nucleoid-associated protein YgaU|nr:peptidoglycan-binding protein LysM [Candidatus Fermentibacteraceae bacterium]MBN2608569.1 peptidoglycan-binding protein LysM [Candidatus Fermentibacteraceae bacterium]